MNIAKIRRISSRSGAHYSTALYYDGAQFMVLGYVNCGPRVAKWENLTREEADVIIDSVMVGKFPPGETSAPLMAPMVSI